TKRTQRLPGPGDKTNPTGRPRKRWRFRFTPVQENGRDGDVLVEAIGSRPNRTALAYPAPNEPNVVSANPATARHNAISTPGSYGAPLAHRRGPGPIPG